MSLRNEVTSEITPTYLVCPTQVVHFISNRRIFMVDKANVYPKSGNNPTISNSDSSKSNLGVCFSGGGSRALTCAWGQMLGLSTLNLIEKARYISSVSGGTWASSIYTYLPDKITDDDLLGAYYPPENLSLIDGTGKLNLNNLHQYSLGQAPAGLGIDELVKWGGLFLIENVFEQSNYKWLWAFLVSQFILECYGLRAEGKHSWSSSKYFSLSLNYSTDHFPEGAPSTDDLFFVRSGRPFLIMNNNIMENYDSNVVQLPNQVTPVSGGAQGQTPDATIIGGGSVESYGYSSTRVHCQRSFVWSILRKWWASLRSTHPTTRQNTNDIVDITLSQPYSLIDIVSTSSAFFAETIANLIKTEVSDPEKKKELISQIEAQLKPEHKETLLAKAKEDFLDTLDIGEDIVEIIGRYLENIVIKDLSFLDKIIPTYNYWPVGKVIQNQETRFTDGGTLENTGILGLLAQTDTGTNNQALISLVVFDNTETPLEKKDSQIIAAGQAAPLFGIDFDTKTGTYQPFTEAQKDPANQDFKATSLITVFNNTEDSSGNTPFGNLVKGLYAASCGASSGEQPDDSKVNTEAAFYELSLTTVHNPLANVTAGRSVKMIYIQNAKMMHWQNEIVDEQLKNEIAEGQEESADPFKAFKDFPYYNTLFKIGLEAKESNALSQMWAWAISDDSSPLKNQLQTFIENAAS